MKRALTLLFVGSAIALWSGGAQAVELLTNGNLDHPGIHENDAIVAWTLTELGGADNHPQQNTATFATFADHTGAGGVGLSDFLRWVSLTHTMRYHAHDHTAGERHVYQGRFKRFPIEDDDHFLVVCRYVECKALRANLVDCAEDWRWGS